MTLDRRTLLKAGLLTGAAVASGAAPGWATPRLPHPAAGFMGEDYRALRRLLPAAERLIESPPMRAARADAVAYLLGSANVSAARIAPERVADYVAGVALVKGLAQLALCEPRVTMIRSPYPLGRAGLDNPDNVYRSVRLDPQCDYVITGRLGTAYDLYIQALDAQPGEGNTLGNSLGTLNAGQLRPDRQGRFTVTLGPGPGDGRSPHLRLHPTQASVLTIRDTFNSWQETPARLTLRQLSGRRVRAELREAPQVAAARAADVIGYWDRYVSRLRQMPLNFVSTPAPSESGGLTGQVSAFGRFGLAADDALMLSVDVADAPYLGLQLGDNLFASTNYWSRCSSRNATQTKATGGRATFVLAARDPGVANWIDTGGDPEGLLFLRWQGLPAGVVPAKAEVRVAPIDAVAGLVPQDRVTAQQRRHELLLRRHAFDRRGMPVPRY